MENDKRAGIGIRKNRRPTASTKVSAFLTQNTADSLCRLEHIVALLSMQVTPVTLLGYSDPENQNH